MACYHPLKVWYSKDLNPSGKRSIVFSHVNALQPDESFQIPCSQCVGCRLERSRQWATRCLHEAQEYENNCFITLTFSPEEIIKRKNPNSLDVDEYQKFMKRLRKRFIPKNPYEKNTEQYKEHHEKYQIRFFHCGEYGDHNGRPHYHALLFNFDFEDKELFKIDKGIRYYISQSLQELWPYGFCLIGDVTFESAAYVARYIMKKATGELAEYRYNINTETGEYLPDSEKLKPEYITMSRRPGIGKKWFDKYHSDVYPKDFITINGKKVKPPKYYDKLYENKEPLDMDNIKEQRQMDLMKRLIISQEEFEAKRLGQKEAHKLLQIKSLQRNHDKEI